ncbi:hypothetical protein CLU84_0881 [Comamonas sp. 26]|nr:hypothetical protein CLU84_0881 [Comamonas sp. 26]
MILAIRSADGDSRPYFSAWRLSIKRKLLSKFKSSKPPYVCNETPSKRRRDTKLPSPLGGGA